MRKVRSHQTRRATRLCVVEEFKSSGLSLSSFSERKKVNIHTLRHWVQKSATAAAEAKPSSLFVEARSFPQPITSSGSEDSIVIILVYGVRLEVPASVSGSWLAGLVRELA